MKNLLFIIVLCIILFIGGKLLLNKPIKNDEQLIQLNEELITHGEIIVSRGKISYSNSVIKDNWLPFNKSELSYTFIYEYYISYQLSKAQTTVYGDKILISLENQFNFNQPTLTDEKFSLSKQIFATKFDEKVYKKILDYSREIVYNKIKEFDTQGYKLSVEKNIINIAKKFNITNIKIIWE